MSGIGWYSWTRSWSLCLILTCLCLVMRHTKLKGYQTGTWAGHTRVVDCIQQKHFVWGKRLPILPIITLDGIIVHNIIKGSANVTSEMFHEFLHELVVHICFPLCMYTNKVKGKSHWLTPTQACIVFWFSTVVKSTMLKRSSSLLKMKPVCHHFLPSYIWMFTSCFRMQTHFLPPYSPEYNLIEQAFSSIKAFLQRNWQDKSLGLIDWACHNITPLKAHRYFKASKYIV